MYGRHYSDRQVVNDSSTDVGSGGGRTRGLTPPPHLLPRSHGGAAAASSSSYTREFMGPPISDVAEGWKRHLYHLTRGKVRLARRLRSTFAYVPAHTFRLTCLGLTDVILLNDACRPL